MNGGLQGMMRFHVTSTAATSANYTADTYWTKFGEREFVTCIKQEQVPSSAFGDTQVIYEVVCVWGCVWGCVEGEGVEDRGRGE